MSNNKNIYIISGPSGVGKDTVIKKLNDKLKNIQIITTVTTRAIRKNEKNNIDYIFVTESQFQNLIDENKLIEWSKVYGNYYGVPKDQIKNEIKNNIIIKTDIQGVRKLKNKIKNATTIFIMPPNIQTLLKRLESRKTDSADEIKKRTKIAEEEIKEHKDFDHTIVNHENKLEKTITSLAKIINN
ncbi:MAG: guanylate kinase [Dehalococcoidia bacterium]